MPRKRNSGKGALYFDQKRKLWIAVVQNGFKPDGRRNQIRRTSKSETVARQKLDALLAEIDQHGSPLGNQTVAEWGAFWLESYKYGKPQTYRTYSSLMKTWVLPVIGKKNVKDVRPSDLARIYNNIRAAQRSTSTALKVHTMLSGFFEKARLERLVSTNVVKDMKAPSAAKTARDALTPDETLTVLRTAEQVRDSSKWVTALYAGVRQGERCGATIDSVDLNSNTFTVQWNLVEGNYEHGCDGTCGRPAAGHCPQRRLLIPEGIDYRVIKGRLMLVPPKSGESRTFTLLPQIAEMLERHIRDLAARPNPYGLLWPADDGTPMLGKEDQREWRELLTLAGIDRPGATTHWARHTAISDLTAAGVPERVIGEIVGHRTPGVTGRYQHVSSKDSAAGMQRLGERRQLES